MIGARKLLFSVIFAVAATAISQAGTYYVTQSGAGSQTGNSLANAWSVANFNSSSTPTGGDTVFFSGTITSQIKPNTSGTGNGAGRLTLDFTGATINVAGSEILISGKNYLTLNGGTFSPQDSSTLVDFNQQTSHDITIQHMSYTGTDDNSITDFVASSYVAYAIVQNNHMDLVAHCWVGDNKAVHDITFLNNYCRGSANTREQTDIFYQGDSSNVTIQGNVLIQRAAGMNSNGQHNDVIQTYHGGSSGGSDPSGWIIRYNWIELNIAGPYRTGDNSWMMWENGTDGAAGFTCKIYSNVFVGDAAVNSGNNGMGCAQNLVTDHVYVLNNTIIRKNGPDGTIGAWSYGGSPGGYWDFRNNVGQEGADGGTWVFLLEGSSNARNSQNIARAPAGTPWNRNFWYQTANCDATLSGPNGSCSINPQFTDYANNNFSLASGSPLKNAGDSTIGAEFNQGICPGATWPTPALCTRIAGNWDVGAYQTSSASGSGPSAPSGLAALVQ